jgi:hypothetical protein
MADEQKAKGSKKKPVEAEAKSSAIRTSPGKIAPSAEIAEPAPTPPQTKSTKQPRLEKKNRSRLPRRQKKAHQKAAAQSEV